MLCMYLQLNLPKLHIHCDSCSLMCYYLITCC